MIVPVYSSQKSNSSSSRNEKQSCGSTQFLQPGPALVMGVSVVHSTCDCCHGAHTPFLTSLPSTARPHYFCSCFFHCCLIPHSLALPGAWHGEGASSWDNPTTTTTTTGSSPHLARLLLKGITATTLLRPLRQAPRHGVGSGWKLAERLWPPPCSMPGRSMFCSTKLGSLK